MSRAAVSTVAVLTMGALIVLLSTWQPELPVAPTATGTTASAEDIRELLRGTWLREYASEGTRVRRVLSLEGGGTFREHARAVDAAGRITEFVHEGTWLFDGTNLKRRYTLMNGQPPSRLKVPLASFQISFDTRNAFTGVDHVNGHRVEYRRVGPGTQP